VIQELTNLSARQKKTTEHLSEIVQRESQFYNTHLEISNKPGLKKNKKLYFKIFRFVRILFVKSRSRTNLFNSSATRLEHLEYFD